MPGTMKTPVRLVSLTAIAFQFFKELFHLTFLLTPTLSAKPAMICACVSFFFSAMLLLVTPCGYSPTYELHAGRGLKRKICRECFMPKASS